MGVKKFTKFVRENYSAKFDGRIFQPTDVLLIDGAGFAFWIASTSGLIGGKPFRTIEASYDRYDYEIRRNIKMLKKAGLSVRIYMDGYINKKKINQASIGGHEELEQIEQQVISHEEALLDNDNGDEEFLMDVMNSSLERTEEIKMGETDIQTNEKFQVDTKETIHLHDFVQQTIPSSIASDLKNEQIDLMITSEESSKKIDEEDEKVQQAEAVMEEEQDADEKAEDEEDDDEEEEREEETDDAEEREEETDEEDDDEEEEEEEEEEKVTTVFKSLTKLKRTEQKQEEWAALQGWLCDGALSSAGARLPIPPLLMDQFKCTMESLQKEEEMNDENGFVIKLCEGEADLFLGIDCAHYMRSQRKKDEVELNYFILGDDSDFYFFKNCQYVCFHDLSLIGTTPSSLSSTSSRTEVDPIANEKLYTSKVWSSEKLTELFGFLNDDDDNDDDNDNDNDDDDSQNDKSIHFELGHTRLCELAALLGNDYTSHMNRRSWKNATTPSSSPQSPSFPSQKSLRCPAAVAQWLSTQPCWWRLQAVQAVDQVALEYSHANYRLCLDDTYSLEKKAISIDLISQQADARADDDEEDEDDNDDEDKDNPKEDDESADENDADGDDRAKEVQELVSEDFSKGTVVLEKEHITLVEEVEVKKKASMKPNIEVIDPSLMNTERRQSEVVVANINDDKSNDDDAVDDFDDSIDDTSVVEVEVPEKLTEGRAITPPDLKLPSNRQLNLFRSTLFDRDTLKDYNEFIKLKLLSPEVVIKTALESFVSAGNSISDEQLQGIQNTATILGTMDLKTQPINMIESPILPSWSDLVISYQFQHMLRVLLSVDRKQSQKMKETKMASYSSPMLVEPRLLFKDSIFYAELQKIRASNDQSGQEEGEEIGGEDLVGVFGVGVETHLTNKLNSPSKRYNPSERVSEEDTIDDDDNDDELFRFDPSMNYEVDDNDEVDDNKNHENSGCNKRDFSDILPSFSDGSMTTPVRDPMSDVKNTEDDEVSKSARRRRRRKAAALLKQNNNTIQQNDQSQSLLDKMTELMVVDPLNNTSSTNGPETKTLMQDDKTPTKKKNKKKQKIMSPTAVVSNQKKEANQTTNNEYKLPIENHEEEICAHVLKNRVTIIHGETGCGKSSTVPLMLMKSHDKTWEANQQLDQQAKELLPVSGYAKMFITQPRRIAARSLCERVKKSISEWVENRSAGGVSSCQYSPEMVGLRLGHGERTNDSSLTRIWFATTGYVVLLLAHHPELFNSHTHLILDEVHERSIDTDVLCLLARKLLHTHPTIKLVLMSATLAAALYQQYFGIPEPPLFVGAKRFAVKELYPEDLVKAPGGKFSTKMFSDLAAKTCKGADRSQQVTNLQIEAAVQIVREIGEPGTSILIFVAGMAEIVEICAKFENLQGGLKQYKIIPIHSELPDEEQAEAFLPAPNMVKVLVATNVAESSITIPDCDTVICFGVHKQIEYNAAKHRTLLSPLWISKASAVQRAGRTGRVRPGTVYRLYSKQLFLNHMSEFDSGEMGRQPLDWVILSLRQMLNEKIVPILEQVLEPPPLEHIDRAFTSLHSDGLVTSPDDDGELTDLGSFISKLGLDIRLGRLIGLGAMFGVLPECVAMACMLSATKSPFRIATELTQKDPRDYSETVNAIMHARHRLDCGILSEPIMYINLLYLYRTSAQKHCFCSTYGLSHLRMKQLNNSYTHLLSRIIDALWKPEKFSSQKMNQKSQSNKKQQKMKTPYLFSGTVESLDIANSGIIDSHTSNTPKPKSIVPSQVRGAMNSSGVSIEDGGEMVSTLNSQLDSTAELEATYPMRLGSAKIGLLKILLVWVYNDQVISQRPSKLKFDLESTPISYDNSQTPINQKSLVVKLVTDHKVETMANMHALLKPPSKLCVASSLSPKWKSCRYYVYHNEGPMVKQALSALNLHNSLQRELLALRLQLQLMIVMDQRNDQVYIWICSQCKHSKGILPPIFFKNVVALLTDNEVCSSYIITMKSKSIQSEIKKQFESFNFDNVIVATTQNNGNKAEILSRGNQLFEQDLDIIFDSGPRYLSSRGGKKNPADGDYQHRLQFYERLEVSKVYLIYCPVDHEEEKESAQIESLAVMRNLPISALILGQTSRKNKFRVHNEARVEDLVTSVSHNVPVPKWQSFWNGSLMMMDAHTLEAGSMLLNAYPSSKTQTRKDETLYGVASNMLDLKSGGSICMSVSILPPGPDFITMALSSFGITVPQQMINKCSKSLGDKMDEISVFNEHCDRLGEKMCYQPELTKWLLSIFDLIPNFSDPTNGSNQNQVEEHGLLCKFGHGSPFSEADIIYPNSREERNVLKQPPMQQMSGQRGEDGGLDDLDLLNQLWHTSHASPIIAHDLNIDSFGAGSGYINVGYDNGGYDNSPGYGNDEDDDEEIILLAANQPLCPQRTSQRRRNIASEIDVFSDEFDETVEEEAIISDMLMDMVINMGEVDSNDAYDDYNDDDEAEDGDNDEIWEDIDNEEEVVVFQPKGTPPKPPALPNQTKQVPVSDKAIGTKAVLSMLQQDGDALKKHKEYRSNYQMVMAAVTQNGLSLRFASMKLQSNLEIVKKAVSQNPLSLEYAGPGTKVNMVVISSALNSNGLTIQYLPKTTKINPKVVQMAVKQNGLALQFAPAFLGNKDMVLLAVKNNGLSLKFASHLIRSDSEVVNVAIKQNPEAARYALVSNQLQATSTPSKALANDEDDVEKALSTVRGNGLALISFPSFTNHARVVTAAVKQNGLAIKYASLDLQSNLEVVCAAMKQNGFALIHVPKQMQNSYQVVLTAVKQNGLALKYASEKARSNMHLAIPALHQNGLALEYVCSLKDKDSLRSNPKVVQIAVKQSGLALQFAPAFIGNKDMVLLAVKNNPDAIKFAAKHLQSDVDVIGATRKKEEVQHTKKEPKLKEVGPQDDQDECILMNTNSNSLNIPLNNSPPKESKLVDNVEVLLTMLEDNPVALRYASEELKSNRFLVIKAVSKNGLVLEYAPETLKSEFNIVMLAVSQNGLALQFASNNLKSNKHIVQAALKQNLSSVQYAIEWTASQ